ncbi:MAG: pyrroline-5-carboxylate reductase [Phycisphaerae bacterium]|jgi:pyrroline-5-carboxylate reductase
MDIIGFIGGGNMAEALIKGIIAAKLYPPENIIASDINSQRLEYLQSQYKIRTTADNAELARGVDILVLSVKPQTMPDVLGGIKDSIDPDTLVISIAAGVKTKMLESALHNVGIIRVMPNTPALIGQGASALYATDRAKPMLRKAQRIFEAVGIVVFVENEDLIDAVTAVSGSGPAYFFLLMEEMIKAATQLGLPHDVSKKLVLQTAKGASLLAAERDEEGETPAQLRKKVTSPRGTTEAALEQFSDGNFGQLVNAAVKRARDRSVELSG